MNIKEQIELQKMYASGAFKADEKPKPAKKPAPKAEKAE